jgi:FMN phosphatase YigB (HAD superfamily)
LDRRIHAVFLDCGDTLVDEDTEVKTAAGVSLRADLIPGAGELMHALKARGYPLALVADGPAATFSNNLGPYGLYHLFDAYAISEKVGCEKPDAGMFLAALAALQIPKTEYGRVVMVGNNLERDIAGANALGLVSVWLDWAPRRSKIPATGLEIPAYTIQAPLDLLNVLDRLEGRQACA